MGAMLLLAEPEPSGWASQQGSTLLAVPTPPGLAPKALTLAQQPVSRFVFSVGAPCASGGAHSIATL